ncbi:MAG: tetratricopeptide repeat protein [Candidatus Firestonebacteria bacterium]|nr:tetratricopeptide repeat protein [Candidatus Firestonebacteria bacterium]
MKNKYFKIIIFCYLIIFLFILGCSKNSTDIKVNNESDTKFSSLPKKDNQILSRDIEKQKIEEYFSNCKYAEFESAMNALQENKQNTEFIDSIYSTIVSSSNALQNLNTWCENRRDSYIAFTVRGYFYVTYAWSAVNKETEQNNPEDSISIFNDRLNLAKSDLEKAYELNPDDPRSAAYLIIVARGLNLDENYMETQFQRAIKSDPYNMAAHINKLNYYARKWYGSHKEMIKFALDTLINSPDNNNLGLTIISMAQSEMLDSIDLNNTYLQKPGIWMKADSKYQALIKNNPKNLELHMYYSEFAMLSQKYDIALKELELIRNNFYNSMDDDILISKNYRVYRNLAYSLYGAEKYKESIEPLKRLIRVNKNDPNNYKLLASNYNKLNDDQNVIKYARQILVIVDLGSARFKECGYLLYELKKYQEAVEVFEDYIKLYGEDAYSYQYLAFSYSELKKYEECIDYAKKYLAINPDSDFFKKWLRQKQLFYLYKTKKYLDAVALANEMIKNNESVAYAYRIIAYCYDNQENYSKAADYAEKALNINPEYKVLKKWIKKRRVYYLHDNHYSKDAIEQSLDAIKEFGDDADFYRILSQNSYNIKEYGKCLEYGKKSLTLDPNQKIFAEWFEAKQKEFY